MENTPSLPPIPVTRQSVRADIYNDAMIRVAGNLDRIATVSQPGDDLVGDVVTVEATTDETIKDIVSLQTTLLRTIGGLPWDSQLRRDLADELGAHLNWPAELAFLGDTSHNLTAISQPLSAARRAMERSSKGSNETSASLLRTPLQNPFPDFAEPAVSAPSQLNPGMSL